MKNKLLLPGSVFVAGQKCIVLNLRLLQTCLVTSKESKCQYGVQDGLFPGLSHGNCAFPALPSVCSEGQEVDEGFTVRSWLAQIPGAFFLPSAPWPYQRPLKQQPVRLWQLASNSSYWSHIARFPGAVIGVACVSLRCLWVIVAVSKREGVLCKPVVLQCLLRLHLSCDKGMLNLCFSLTLHSDLCGICLSLSLCAVHWLGVLLAQVVGSAFKCWPLPCDSFCNNSSFQV